CLYMLDEQTGIEYEFFVADDITMWNQYGEIVFARGYGTFVQVLRILLWRASWGQFRVVGLTYGQLMQFGQERFTADQIYSIVDNLFEPAREE
ncbi:hypothetical protein PFISCL1PPCAC_3250, partial [Pristionchus fissidentatus]